MLSHPCVSASETPPGTTCRLRHAMTRQPRRIAGPCIRFRPRADARASLRWGDEGMSTPPASSGRCGTRFRCLDSNQNDQSQSLAGCQLPHTGVRRDLSLRAVLAPQPQTTLPEVSCMQVSGGPHSSAVGLRSACGPITRHGGARPAFNLLVKVAAAPHVDTQAAMIVLAHVLPHRLWVVALQRGGTELIG